MECMSDPTLPRGHLPPIPEGSGIIPIAENRIARGPYPELLDLPPEGFAPFSCEPPAPVENDALEQLYRRVLSRALVLASCALLFAALVAASLVHNESLRQGFFAAQLLFRVIFVVQVLFVGYCSRYVERLTIVPAAMLLFAYSGFCALEFSALIAPATLAVAFLCVALMYAAAASWGFIRRADLALPITGVFMILAGGAILVAVNCFLRTPSSAWTLSAMAVVIFACLSGYYGQQIRDFYQEYDDDNARGWKASVLGALLLIVNSVNLYLLAITLLSRNLSDDDTSDELPR